MKKINLVLTFVSVMFILSSCMPYIKLFETDSSGTKKTSDNYIAFENDTLIVTYNLWDNYGKMFYTVYNKLKVPIYVDWKKSGYILNNKNYNYWQDKTVSKMVNNFSYFPGSRIPNMSTETIAIHDERSSFIPPNSWIEIPFSYILISDELDASYTSSDGKKITIESVDLRHDRNATRTSVGRTWTNSGKTVIWEKTFTPETSPLNFRNFMTYSTVEPGCCNTDDPKKENFVSTTFTIKKMTEMNVRQFYGKGTRGVRIVRKGKRTTTTPVIFYDFPYKSGDRFYLNLTK